MKVIWKSTDPVYNTNREFASYGELDKDGNFVYDGNWEAVDNTMYRFEGHPDGQKEIIPCGEFKIK